MIYMKVIGISIGSDVLGLAPGYRPLLMGALQFLAAFLTGVGLNESVVRYKSAMSGMIELVENFRSITKIFKEKHIKHTTKILASGSGQPGPVRRRPAAS